MRSFKVKAAKLSFSRANHCQGIPVIWVQHSDDEMEAGSPDWPIVPELVPAAGEARIYKHFNSSFENTASEETLAQLGATHISLASAATNWCIRATSYAALDRGYDLTLIKDAHTTGSIEFEDGDTIEAEDIILELNVAMRWLTYPCHTNRTVSSSEIDFASRSDVKLV